MDSAKSCPKCNGVMEQGFVPDYSHASVLVTGWQEGEPQKSLWRGTKADYDTAIKIRSFRCVTCGYLESYAI